VIAIFPPPILPKIAISTRPSTAIVLPVADDTDDPPSRFRGAARPFGRHVRSLRRARGMTQEVLAERCGLSSDTIRRLEHGSFSPSLDTLNKLCGGLDLMMSTLFESYELGERSEARELVDLLLRRSPRERLLALAVLRALFAELDG
jgi:transcriptional regulator with XRE-family HTH domain